MSQRKLERLMNLLIMLLTTRRPLTVEEIRELHPAYDQGDAESFRRMFERDKDELRDLGVPLETAYLDAWETEQGYIVRRADYELPAIALEPDEAAAVALAARLWQSAGLAEASRTALLKLQAAGVDAQALEITGVEPRVEATDQSFEPFLAASRARQPVAFGYRVGGAGEPARRTVEPWGLVHRRGRWYLVGHDRDRGATRVFRLSRVVGDVQSVDAAGAFTPPADLDLAAQVVELETQAGDREAVLRLRAGTCWEIRRTAVGCSAEDGWDVCQVPLGDVDRLADTLVGHGPDVVVVEPADLRAAVVVRLQAAVATAVSA
ncbi:MAG TPA: WYL domain-containing protein [Mycobacteriales bacterium]|nr:WYL domain-containing protein [Mycobacteriales bacterium]